MTWRDVLMLLAGILVGVAAASLWVTAARRRPGEVLVIPGQRRLLWRWLVVAVVWLVALAAAGGLVWLWVYTPELYAGADPNTQTAAAATTRTGIFAAFAGLVAVASLIVNATVSQQALSETSNANRLAHERELEGQVTDRYTKAIELLGSDNRAARLGGIHALERIANDSGRDLPTVIEVLSSFVRQQSVDDVTEARGHPNATTDDLQVNVDVQAAVIVLTRLPHQETKTRIDLSDASLIRIRLNGGSLAGAVLRSVDFFQARLGRVDLTNAWLHKASLREAWMHGVPLTGAHLGEVDLSGAHNLRQDQLEEATGDPYTRLPSDLDWPPTWEPPAVDANTEGDR